MPGRATGAVGRVGRVVTSWKGVDGCGCVAARSRAAGDVLAPSWRLEKVVVMTGMRVMTSPKRVMLVGTVVGPRHAGGKQGTKHEQYVKLLFVCL